MAILVSLLAHAGLMASFVGGGMRLGGNAAPRAMPRNAAKPSPAISNVHLVELPANVATAPPSAPTDLVSDRAARGTTPIVSENGSSPLPQILGDSPSLDTPSARPASELPRSHGLDARQKDGGALGVDASGGEGRTLLGRDNLNGGGDGDGDDGDAHGETPRRELQDAGASGSGVGWPSLPLPSSLGMGGVSFNTLEWDFAPYALELKQRIASHWFPPIAFTQGGLFGGVSVVRFRISPAGILDECGLISQAEHSSLDTAALNAVRFSVPFQPLPKDFPEPFLEVTFSFHYLLGPRTRPEN